MTRPLPTSLLMFIAARAASTRIFEAVRDSGFDDLTIAQSRLMMGVDPDGTRLSVLAARAQIAKQTATALVDKLERAGYVERVPDPADGRATLVSLAPAGKRLLDQLDAAGAEVFDDLTEEFASDELRSLAEMLTRLNDRADAVLGIGTTRP